MSPRVEAVLEIVSVLSENERAELATRLIDSLDGEPDPDVEAAWDAELDRRLDEDDEGKIPSIPWEEAYEKLLKTCK